MKPITIDEIDYTVPYEGYVWYSGQPKPELIKDKFDKSYFAPLARPDSLFIIEGNLWDEANKRSISIRNVDGQYLIYQADLADIKDEQLTSQTYKSHRLGNAQDVQYVEMKQYWDEEEDKDKLLEGMKTLVPTWTAFVGFVK